MYFPSTFLVFVQLSSVLAIHPFVLSNPHHKRNHSLARLQYRVPRALIDTCVSLDADVSLDALQQLSILEPLLAPLATSAATDLCLCLKDLDIYLGTNTNVQALNEISATLAAVIDTSPDSRQCDLPPNAKRSCTSSEPCRWTCETNFIREDETCLASLLKLAVELKLGGSRLSTSPASYEGILYPVLESVAGLLTSPQVASLLTNTNNLLDSLNASLKELNDCNCINSFDLRGLTAQLEAMLAGTDNLKRRLAMDPIGTIGTTSNSTSNRARMSNASNMPIGLNLSGLLDSLGLHIDLEADNDLVAFLLDGFGTTDASGPLLETNVAINLNTLLDSVLRLVLDTNDALKLNVSLDLKAHVCDIAKATDDYIDSILKGRPLGLELSVLLGLTGTAKDVSEPPLLSINLDLDHILDVLATMTQQPPPMGDIDGSVDRRSLLNDLEMKRLQIDTAVKGLVINLDSTLLSASVDIDL
ncbi:hypothetical protein M378DRAFT_11076 [Amanita muscaria Koide BX008]|uniref:Uncharacterized protein n=1 Tax=Amanita muscaria (strain Koide BX008) TaxID=946122 RepID=A0A0C2WTA8_AMAMK|nr:hypothetical protein M378DRAFT_11076 [Amanita muscaria Koide BX008]